MAQRRPECDGFVSSLQGERVLCTGKTYVDGESLKRSELLRAIRRKGGWTVEGTRNADVTLLVVGVLPVSVTDPVNHRSQNLVYVEDQRVKGNHVCIVDDGGINALLRGDEAPCLRSRAVGPGLTELSLPTSREVTGPRLVPLKVFGAPHHDPTGLALDLSGLDTGTAAHQERRQGVEGGRARGSLIAWSHAGGVVAKTATVPGRCEESIWSAADQEDAVEQRVPRDAA